MIRTLVPWIVVGALLVYGYTLISNDTHAAAGGSLIFGVCAGVLAGAADKKNRSQPAS